jgi:hypothetical protein
MMTSTEPIITLGSVAFLLAATLIQENDDRNNKLWNIRSTEIYSKTNITHNPDARDVIHQ